MMIIDYILIPIFLLLLLIIFLIWVCEIRDGIKKNKRKKEYLKKYGNKPFESHDDYAK